MKSSQISLKDQNMTTRGVVLRIPSLFSQVLLNDQKSWKRGYNSHESGSFGKSKRYAHIKDVMQNMN